MQILARGNEYRTISRNVDEKERRMPLTDNWDGFADLLANLIEKYAAVLDIDNLPKPPPCLKEENSLGEFNDTIESTKNR